MKKTAFSKIEQWSKYSDFDEKKLEFLLLYDLFRYELNYKENTAISQEPSGKRIRYNGRIDILLKPLISDPSSWVCVELKTRAFNFEQKTSFERVMRQTGRYMVSFGAAYGIISNFNRWYFIEVSPKNKNSRNVYIIRSLLMFDIGPGRPEKLRARQMKHLQKALQRCRKDTVTKFFSTLSAFQDVLRDRNGAIKKEAAPTKLYEPIQERVSMDVNNNDAMFMKRLIGDLATHRASFDLLPSDMELKVKTLTPI